MPTLKNSESTNLCSLLLSESVPLKLHYFLNFSNKKLLLNQIP